MVYILVIMVWEGIDKRKFPRIRYRCLIRVSRNGQEEVTETFTENIGLGGISVVLKESFGLFEAVSLEIFIDGSVVKCDGTIVWVVKKHPMKEEEIVMYDTGIEFHNMDAEGKTNITRLVEDILKSDT